MTDIPDDAQPHQANQTKEPRIDVTATGGAGGSQVSISSSGAAAAAPQPRSPGTERLFEPAGGDGAAATLGSLDFASIIGGPLVAAVNASAQAALATAAYIMQVGFESDTEGNSTVKTVTFSYDTYVSSTTSSNQSTQVSASITVPLLSMLPIPYLRIDSMTIDLKVQLQAMSAVTNTNTFGTTNEINGSTGGFLSLFETAQFQVTVADTNVNTAVSQQSSDYSLEVTVHAGVDPMPAGMQQVLNIFNATIVQQATAK